MVEKDNREVMELYGNTDIVNIVRGQRLRWLGLTWRLYDERLVKRVFSCVLSGKKRRGRPK